MSLSNITLTSGTNKGKIKGDFLGIDVSGALIKSYTPNGSLLITCYAPSSPQDLNSTLFIGNNANNQDILNLKNLNINENLKFNSFTNITSNNNISPYNVITEETGNLFKFCNNGFSFKAGGVLVQGFKINANVLSQLSASIQTNNTGTSFFSAKALNTNGTYFSEYVKLTSGLNNIESSPSFLSFINNNAKLKAGTTGSITLETLNTIYFYGSLYGQGYNSSFNFNNNFDITAGNQTIVNANNILFNSAYVNFMNGETTNIYMDSSQTLINTAIIAPQYGNGAQSGAGSLIVVDRNNNFKVLTSSERFKMDIREAELNPLILYELQPKQYKYLEGKDDYFGYIAEDLEHMGAKELFFKDNEDKPYSVNYPQLTVLIVELLKTLNNRLIAIGA